MIPAPRGVLRCSGPFLFEELQAWMDEYAAGHKLLENRSIQYFECHLYKEFSFEIAALTFCAPQSATGENVVEFHLPGNLVLLQKLEQSLLSCGLLAAQPGEFTRRAFLNGRLDLSQAEAVLELVQSRSVESARAATQLLSGGLGQQMAAVRDELMASLVELEAGLDFEEGDSQDLEPAEVIGHVMHAQQILRDALHTQQLRIVTRGSRFGCLLLGPPNAGKSTLFSSLTKTPSLVSEQAGTTRDCRRSAWINMRGEMAVDVIDFPGLGGLSVDERDARARELANDFNQADMTLLCLHPHTPPEMLPETLPDMPLLVVFTHADLASHPHAELEDVLRERLGDYKFVHLSIDEDENAAAAVLEQAIESFFNESEGIIAQRIRNGERYQQALSAASASVDQAEQWLAMGGQQDLVAAELHQALAVLAELVGEMTPDDLLDRLFSAFCVGK
ncbi:MAG: tRNA modification GTPase [Myxococcota bacterium]|jgi:tRNA modification GTPase